MQAAVGATSDGGGARRDKGRRSAADSQKPSTTDASRWVDAVAEQAATEAAARQEAGQSLRPDRPAVRQDARRPRKEEGHSVAAHRATPPPTRRPRRRPRGRMPDGCGRRSGPTSRRSERRHRRMASRRGSRAARCRADARGGRGQRHGARCDRGRAKAVSSRPRRQPGWRQAAVVAEADKCFGNWPRWFVYSCFSKLHRNHISIYVVYLQDLENFPPQQ